MAGLYGGGPILIIGDVRARRRDIPIVERDDELLVWLGTELWLRGVRIGSDKDQVVGSCRQIKRERTGAVVHAIVEETETAEVSAEVTAAPR